MSDFPELVAHRGAMRYYPENTLLSLEAAIAAGAPHVEFDIQLAADGVPMVFHDETLERTAGRPERVMSLTAADLVKIPAHVPHLFGDTFATECIPRLADVVTLMNRTPGVHAFVEIKRQSLMEFGVEECVNAIEVVMQAAQFRWTLISFIQDALECARRRHHREIGWILREYNLTARRIAEIMQPEYLFCNADYIHQPLDQLWPGRWEWVIYDIDNPVEALRFHHAGAKLIETCCIRDLMEDRRLRA